MVPVREVYTRCGVRPVQIHHRLLRSRGGDVLDNMGETDHLIALCMKHHNWAHAHPAQALKSGLIIDGQVTIEGSRVVYRGTDWSLKLKYGEDRYEVRSPSGGSESSEGSREHAGL